MNCKKSGEFFILHLEDGEEIISSIQNFMQKENIKSGFFFGLGGVRNPLLGVYDPLNSKFIKNHIKGIYEVVSFHGNASVDPDNTAPFIHAHIAIALKDFSVKGGHLFNSEVAVTMEMVFFPTKHPIVREFDPTYRVLLWKYI